MSLYTSAKLHKYMNVCSSAYFAETKSRIAKILFLLGNTYFNLRNSKRFIKRYEYICKNEKRSGFLLGATGGKKQYNI